MKKEFVREVIDHAHGIVLKQYRICVMGHWEYYTTVHPYFSPIKKRPWRFVKGKLTQD